MEENGHSVQRSVGCVSAIKNPESGFVEEEAEDEDTAKGLEYELHFSMPTIAKSYQLEGILQEDTNQESSVDRVKEIILLIGEVGGVKAAEY